MHVFLWILQGLLAVAFGGAGLMKVGRSREALLPRFTYMENLSAPLVKVIGTLELAAAVGLVLPAATGIAPVLTPLAATGLVLLMIGAAGLHARRREPQGIAFNALLLALAGVVAWGRFGPYAF